MIIDTNIATLDRSHSSESEYQLALRHAPRIRFNLHEPFLPSVAGYTVVYRDAPSPSFPRQIVVPVGTYCVIEYAIWWDWNIRHLGELQHIWIYLDNSEEVIATDASSLDGYRTISSGNDKPPLESGRVTLYSSPGTHDLTPVYEEIVEYQRDTTSASGFHAGMVDARVERLVAGAVINHTPLNNQLVRTYLERLAFEPSFEFSNIFPLDRAVFVPWDNLFHWIPGRLSWWTQSLARSIPPNERRVLRIAHRGASAYAQEGSATSLRNAAELGADMVEIDIRFTCDNVPVVTHDADLRRIFGVPGQISECTIDDLRRLTPPDREPLLTFDELAGICRDLELGLYLDIKEVNAAAFKSVAATLKNRGMLGDTIFGSFRPDFLAEIKAELPQAATSVLFASTHIDPVALAQSVGASFVHPCWERFENPQDLLTRDWLQRVDAACLSVVCWHEERPAVITALQALGVYAICSDMPELLMP